MCGRETNILECSDWRCQTERSLYTFCFSDENFRLAIQIWEAKQYPEDPKKHYCPVILSHIPPTLILRIVLIAIWWLLVDFISLLLTCLLKCTASILPVFTSLFSPFRILPRHRRHSENIGWINERMTNRNMDIFIYAVFRLLNRNNIINLWLWDII